MFTKEECVRIDNDLKNELLSISGVNLVILGWDSADVANVSFRRTLCRVCVNHPVALSFLGRLASKRYYNHGFDISFEDQTDNEDGTYWFKIELPDEHFEDEEFVKERQTITHKITALLSHSNAMNWIHRDASTFVKSILDLKLDTLIETPTQELLTSNDPIARKLGQRVAGETNEAHTIP